MKLMVAGLATLAVLVGGCSDDAPAHQEEAPASQYGDGGPPPEEGDWEWDVDHRKRTPVARPSAVRTGRCCPSRQPAPVRKPKPRKTR